MRKIPALVLLTTVFLVSCDKKIKNVHFYGRAYLECDGSPIVNEEVRIDVMFDAGVSASNLVATTITDGNGNYSVMTNVRYDGSFENYSIRLTNQSYYPRASQISGNSEESHKVGCDLPCGKYNKANFHFKNTQPPIDAGDVLYNLYISYDSSTYSQHYLNLQGAAIDTIIPLNFSVGKIYYKYDFKKNGIEDFSPVSYFDVECNADANIDVFY
jgi:hypothetical protein